VTGPARVGLLVHLLRALRQLAIGYGPPPSPTSSDCSSAPAPPA